MSKKTIDEIEDALGDAFDNVVKSAKKDPTSYEKQVAVANAARALIELKAKKVQYRGHLDG